MTGLGEFLPIGRLFSLGSFSKITEVAQISGLLISAVKNPVLILRKKNELGYILRDIFENASGHPGRNRQN